MRLFGRDIITRRAILPILFATTALTAILAGRLNAALPPPYEIWREFGLVTADSQIPRMLNAHGLVDRIERVNDGYRVWAGNCFVPVAIVAVEQKPGTPVVVGPAQIRTESRPVQCR